jgi:protein ImuA
MRIESPLSRATHRGAAGPLRLSSGGGQRVAPVAGRVVPDCRWSFGVDRVDAALGGGLMRGQVHEVYAAEEGDAAAAAGFAMAVLTGLSGEGEQRARPVLWLRTTMAARRGGVLQAQGWVDLGGAPHQHIFGVLPDGLSALRAALDAVRSGTLAAVMVEHWGRLKEMDLTASRRFVLSAEASGTTVLFLHVDAETASSAAQTRWSVAAAPSVALPGKAPGAPVFDVELTRQRAGPSGMRWQLEWDREQGIFRDAALSGDTLPVPARAAGAGAGTGPDSVRWVA